MSTGDKSRILQKNLIHKDSLFQLKLNSMTRKRIFSGVQPSGSLMLGNYLGALKQWVRLQEQDYECLFCIVDLHSITVPQDPQQLRAKTLESAAIYLACGIDPTKSLVFVQSQVPQHTELAWILGTMTSMGALSRMTQFKDKSAKHQHIGSGLFTYPVLMAADILLYDAHLVPVGADQKQHLELTRDLAERFNSHYKKDIFRIPDIFVAPQGARIMSLQKPNEKMSKSDTDTSAVIFLNDSNDTIVKKLKRAVTDSGSEICVRDDKPGVSNLLNIQSAITGKTIDSLTDQYQGKQYGHLKLETADIIISCVEPIRNKTEEYLKDQATLAQLLTQSATKARAIAEEKIGHVKDVVGFLP